MQQTRRSNKRTAGRIFRRSSFLYAEASAFAKLTEGLFTELHNLVPELLEFTFFRLPYTALNASIGSVDAARVAGIADATSAITIMIITHAT